MRIRYERSGGFANIGMKYEADSDKLPDDKSKQMKRLIEEARIFDQPAEPSASANAPDQFEYALTVEDGGRAHTVRTTDTAASPELVRLIDWLSAEALVELKQRAKRP